MAKHFFTKIAGISHYQRQLAGLQPGEWLTLRPEPENRHDKNAIAVFRSNGKQLGYLSADVAEGVARDIAKGFSFAALAVEVTGLDKDTLGCNIQVFRKEPKETDNQFQEYIGSNAQIRQAQAPKRKGLGCFKLALLLVCLFVALLIGLGVLAVLFGN